MIREVAACLFLALLALSAAFAFFQGWTEGGVKTLIEWANKRIAECRKHEKKFPPQSDVMIEAYTERRTLQQVLSIIGGSDAE